MEIRPLAQADVAACEGILRALPEWFGIEESIVQYVADLATTEGFVAVEAGAGVIGFLALRHYPPHASDIHVMGVGPEHHGRGVGRALIDRAVAVLRARHVEFLQVKTLGPSRENAHYAGTRAFYQRMGFRALEENRLWGPVNPCLILVQHIRCPGDPAQP